MLLSKKMVLFATLWVLLCVRITLGKKEKDFLDALHKMNATIIAGISQNPETKIQLDILLSKGKTILVPTDEAMRAAQMRMGNLALADAESLLS